MTPEPNCTCSTFLDVKRVTNLRGTFRSFRVLGTKLLSELVFVSLSKTVSWPRNGTSYHMLPSLSVMSKIPIISSPSISTVANLSAVV